METTTFVTYVAIPPFFDLSFSTEQICEYLRVVIESIYIPSSPFLAGKISVLRLILSSSPYLRSAKAILFPLLVGKI